MATPCFVAACMCAKLLWSCLNLCDIMDCSPPGSSVHGILQARILGWVVMPSFRGSSQPRDRTRFSHVSALAGVFFATSTTWEARFMTTGYCLKINKYYKTTKKERESLIFSSFGNCGSHISSQQHLAEPESQVPPLSWKMVSFLHTYMCLQPT